MERVAITQTDHSLICNSAPSITRSGIYQLGYEYFIRQRRFSHFNKEIMPDVYRGNARDGARRVIEHRFNNVNRGSDAGMDGGKGAA